jgi:CRP/FNR family transcriptional regulator, cyclic AMP receptor protein
MTASPSRLGVRPGATISPTVSQRTRRAVPLLEIDPDLGREIDRERLQSARSGAVAGVTTLAVGEWPHDALDLIDPEGAIGLLVIEGLMSREVTVAGGMFAELIGDGEILRPWEAAGDGTPSSVKVTWNVMEPMRLAILDRTFVLRAARWPELSTALVARAVRRSRALTVQLAICNLPRVETRLLMLMWHLADRWGRVTTEGVVLPLGLTHRLLASLVGARRPTVTTALKHLTEQQRISRRADGCWILHGERPLALGQLNATLS